MATKRLHGGLRMLASFATVSIGIWSGANAYADTWTTSTTNGVPITSNQTTTKVGIALSPANATPAGSLEVRSATNSLDALVVNQAATGTQGAIARFRQSGTTKIIMTGPGRLGIGTQTPSEQLHVVGNVQVTGTVNADAGLKIKGQWSLEVPDYVFEAKYKPMGLADLESYVRTNKHLPEVPSATEMKNQGMDVATMNLTLLKKVEELTLYVIEQDKKIKELSAKIQ